MIRFFAYMCLAVVLFLVAGCRTKPEAHGMRMVGESLVLVKEQSGYLCYDQVFKDSVIVRSTYEPNKSGTIVYEADRDYIVDRKRGCIRRTVDSRIPDFSTNMLFGKHEFDHNQFPGFGNRDFTVWVDYETNHGFDFAVPSEQSSLLAKTKAKLSHGGPFKLIVYGDSIAAGGDASETKLQFPHRYAACLHERFPKAHIEVENGATGGDSTAQGLKRLEEKVFARKPDLVLVGFGMNDHNINSVSVDDFERNLITIVRAIQEKTGAEAILFSTFPPNPEWKYGSHRMRQYADATVRAAEQIPCAYADVYNVWLNVLSRKDFPSVLANNINHPNDFGHWLYLQALNGVQF